MLNILVLFYLTFMDKFACNTCCVYVFILLKEMGLEMLQATCQSLKSDGSQQ